MMGAFEIPDLLLTEPLAAESKSWQREQGHHRHAFWRSPLHPHHLGNSAMKRPADPEYRNSPRRRAHMLHGIGYGVGAVDARHRVALHLLMEPINSVSKKLLQPCRICGLSRSVPQELILGYAVKPWKTCRFAHPVETAKALSSPAWDNSANCCQSGLMAQPAGDRVEQIFQEE